MSKYGSVLDVLWDTNEESHWTRHFGPISGSDPKLSNPAERYVITSFAYGTNMGATQLAKHMRGIVTEHEITFANRRHITSEKLEAAKTDLINRYHLYDLPKCWGDETIAAADGTQIELYENNLLSSYHIRYGSYGGIAYHVVSSLYIALYSHFLRACLGNDHRARTKAEEPADMSELRLASPISGAEASQEAASAYFPNTL